MAFEVRVLNRVAKGNLGNRYVICLLYEKTFQSKCKEVNSLATICFATVCIGQDTIYIAWN